MIDDTPSRGDIEVVTVDAGTIAEDIGDMRAANMVMLGSFVKKTNMVKLSTVIDGLGEIFGGKKKVVEMNTRALELGYSSI
jgi:2-oxoglutarate ferredoxin oxidoreductase subunit gamma